MSGAVHIGTSGWNYKHWIGRFYPTGLPQKKWLAYYADHFETVEINNTFYHLPQLTTFANWRDSVPPQFFFAVKGSRFITHMKKLKEPKTSSEKFFHGVSRLEQKLGPILFQLPPSWRVNLDRLAMFLEKMPLNHQYVFEFRNETWLHPEVYKLLRAHNVALCIHDFRRQQSPREITADFTYVRMHGPTEAAYWGSYSLRSLRSWAWQIKKWQQNLEVYVYFNNDVEGCAVKDARRLKEML